MLGWRQNWGNVVDVLSRERTALPGVVVVPIELKLQTAATAYSEAVQNPSGSIRLESL